MLRIFRNTMLGRLISIASLWGLGAQLFIPLESLALTGGPSMPEVQGFEPAGTTELVDPATGDFSYNISLMDVEGYPLNISYRSGVNPESEASSVGLGWKLNIGEINRQMRLPFRASTPH